MGTRVTVEERDVGWFAGKYRLSSTQRRVGTLAAMLLLATAAPSSAGTVRYSYDAQGRLAMVTYSDGTIISYTYDAAGNRTASSVLVGCAVWGGFNWGQANWCASNEDISPALRQRNSAVGKQR